MTGKLDCPSPTLIASCIGRAQPINWRTGCVFEGDMVLSIPLSIIAIIGSRNFVNSYNIQGVWLQDPPHCGPNAGNKLSRNSRPSFPRSHLEVNKW